MPTIKKKILFNNPFVENRPFINEIRKKINLFLKNNINYILGDNVQKLEKEIINYTKAKYCVGVNNGTDAIYLALKSLGIKKNDEIILPSHTASATLSAVLQAGGKPIFVDIDLNTYTICLSSLKKLINKKTKAIIIVHIYGQSALNKKFLRLINNINIPVIEDCAQSFGALFENKFTGTFGKIGCYSFFPTKNLGAMGDAGALITNNKTLYKKIVKLRQYGWDKNKICRIEGYNSRLDELQSIILRIKLKYLKKSIIKKNSIAKYYNNHLKNLPIITPKLYQNVTHSFHLYVIRVNPHLRNKLIKFLILKKIYCGIHYKIPLHLMPIFNKKYNKSNLKNTNKVIKEIISLPMYSELKKTELVYIIKQIKLFYKKHQ